MRVSRAQSTSRREGAHLVLYDGVCGLCSRLVQFLLAHDSQTVFQFASLQSATGQAIIERAGRDPRQLTTFYIFANHQTSDGQLLEKSDAALFLVNELGWPWRLLQCLRLLPKALLDRLYDLVARSRYRVFGKYEQCRLPPPDFRNRFVD